jgi:hypothetical protein
MAKQLNFANRRPRPLGLRGKERIAFSSLPSRADIEEVLTMLTANITLKQEDLPRRQLELTPTINNYYDSGKGLFYEELLNIDLLEEDMLTDKPRTASLTKLCRALSIGHYTALGNAPPLQYSSRPGRTSSPSTTTMPASLTVSRITSLFQTRQFL